MSPDLGLGCRDTTGDGPQCLLALILHLPLLGRFEGSTPTSTNHSRVAKRGGKNYLDNVLSQDFPLVGL